MAVVSKTTYNFIISYFLQCLNLENISKFFNIKKSLWVPKDDYLSSQSHTFSSVDEFNQHAAPPIEIYDF